MALPVVAAVIVALRRDMGFTNTTIKAREIMGIVVKEIDDVGPLFDRWEKVRTDWDRKMGWN